jgi:hypothetical protein
MRDFKAIVEHDPRHLDANRELRLYNMRRGDRPQQPGEPSDAKPGGVGKMLGKLFKR